MFSSIHLPPENWTDFYLKSSRRAPEFICQSLLALSEHSLCEHSLLSCSVQATVLQVREKRIFHIMVQTSTARQLDGPVASPISHRPVSRPENPSLTSDPCFKRGQLFQHPVSRVDFSQLSVTLGCFANERVM